MQTAIERLERGELGVRVTASPWLFEVARVPRQGNELEAVAREFYSSWASQGVQQESCVLVAQPLGARRGFRATFEGRLDDGSPLRSRARWIEHGDAAVMLALNTEWTDPEESIALLDGAAESLEFLAAPEPAAKPWWRFW